MFKKDQDQLVTKMTEVLKIWVINIVIDRDSQLVNFQHAVSSNLLVIVGRKEMVDNIVIHELY